MRLDKISQSVFVLISGLDSRKEGLPFWLLYLLLSLILLLIFINFLQNKDLRQKLNYFLLGPRRRYLRLRLQVKLKNEEENKAELFKKLGQLAVQLWPELPEIKEIVTEIRPLEEKKIRFQSSWHEIYKQLEAIKLELKKNKTSNNPDFKNTGQYQTLVKKAELLEKNKAEIEETLWKINGQLAPHHQLIGRIIYNLRPEREDLAFLYFQLDKTEKNIKSIKEEIKRL